MVEPKPSRWTLVACALLIVACAPEGRVQGLPNNPGQGEVQGRFTWDAEPEAWEAAADVQVQAFGKSFSRAEHKWVDYGIHVPFVCEERGGRLKAVPTRVIRDREVVTPSDWSSGQFGTFLLANLGGALPEGVPAPTVDVQEANVRAYDTRTEILERGDCFAVQWEASLRKDSATYSYTLPPAAASLPAPLENDLDDRLEGMIEICCCSWLHSMPELDRERDRVGDPGDPSRTRPFDEETPRQPSNSWNPEEEGLLYVDWIATPLHGPTRGGGPGMSWRGFYETKQCSYSEVPNVVRPDGTFTTKRVRNATYDPASEDRDADDTPIGP